MDFSLRNTHVFAHMQAKKAVITLGPKRPGWSDRTVASSLSAERKNLRRSLCIEPLHQKNTHYPLCQTQNTWFSKALKTKHRQIIPYQLQKFRILKNVVQKIGILITNTIYSWSINKLEPQILSPLSVMCIWLHSNISF